MRRSRGRLKHWKHATYSAVIPAKAGIQSTPQRPVRVSWIPAFAGMTQSSLGSRGLMSLMVVCIP
ncbi:hypothetical protein EI613_25610 [Azospirillum sp. 412522]|nr:hypothetical protein [Azospirillum sp. 412522]